MNAELLEHTTMRKVWWRIVPLMTLGLFCSYLDKVNIGFAALTMNEALGFSNTVFGAGAGFFAIGYAIFGIPSALLLHRFGARRWIAIIAFAWGAFSAGTAFISNPAELLGVRMLLGMAEAGFNPGVIFFFSLWFPSEYRGRVLSSFLFIMPVGMIIGGPLSSILLSWDGLLGLSGWQWLFIIEALPTFLLATLVLTTLTDRPENAHWLAAEEKKWLLDKLESEREAIAASPANSAVRKIFTDKRVMLLALVNLGVGTSGIGALIFLPLVIQSMGFSTWHAGFISAAPAAIAALVLPFWGMWTDRSQNRKSVVAFACTLIATGLVLSAPLLPSAWALLPLTLALIGFYGSIVAFWTLPSAFLIGASAAAGIAFINIAGNLGTFTGPFLLGWLSDVTDAYQVGLVCLGVISGVSGLILATTNALTQPPPTS